MKGDLILERISDPELRTEWHKRLQPIFKAVKKLNEIKVTADSDPTGLKYLEAVLEFIEARDEERTYFWSTFVRKGTEDIKFDTADN